MAYGEGTISDSIAITKEEENLERHLKVANPLNGNNHPILVGDEICPLEISKDSVQYRKAPSNQDDIVNKKYVDNSLAFREILRSNFHGSSTSITFIPFNTTTERTTSMSTYNDYCGIVAPYDGQLERVIVRSESVPSSTICGLHKSGLGTETPSDTASYTSTMTMASDDTSYVFEFGNATFSAGDIMAISLDPSANMNDTNVTVVFRYNSPMVGA